MENNLKEFYKLADIIKEVRLTRKNVPTNKTILGFLKGSEFDRENLTLNTIYDYKTSRSCKKFIETAIKIKNAEQKDKNKQDRIYLYMYLGGTEELKNTFKIDAKDHLSTKQFSPKGCDKYCTENQIGKPQNWVRLPPIILPNGDYIDEVKNLLNNHYNSCITKIANDIYKVEDGCFIDIIKNIRNSIFTRIDLKWFNFNLHDDNN